MWCSKFKDIGREERTIHCLGIDDPRTSQCEDDAGENPDNSQTIVRNDPLSESARDSKRSGTPIVQIKPQEVKVKLRKGVSESIRLTYRQAFGYPIDLYYLMDLSYSMLDDKAKLASLGGQLTATLQELTDFYHIGFGSFVDKVLMPFVDTHPNNINSPCDGCAKPYSFRNDLPLGEDGSLFAKRVTEAKISGNLDAPEGGFDALMQAIVCKDEIKWRDQARRLIVFSTDAQFHQAGDGKLAGVVVPNDELCHMNDQNMYDAYDRFDYPSVGQINKVTKERDIYVIFAVSAHSLLYEKLTKFIDNSSWGKLSGNSDNVVDLVRDQYNAISSVISLTDNSSDAISIEYFSKCKDASSLMKTNQCFNMREGDQVDFTLQVKLNECPKGRDREIVEVKTLQDSLFLEIEFICGCECEDEDDHSIPSEICTGQGALVCGVCACLPQYRGEKCRCKADGTGDDNIDQELCKVSVNSTEVCSGRGHCVCGSCECFQEDFSGAYCHCNRRKCLSHEGDICSNHGTCACESCTCVTGYTGRVCECQTDEACRLPGQHEVCSGHGVCDCGKCVCNSTSEESYTGQYCEDCLSCIGGKCSEFHAVVLCQFRDPTSNACNQTVIIVDSLDDEERGTRLCSFVDEEDDCMIFFTYRYLDNSKSYEIHVQKDKQCPEPAPIMAIAFGILAGIVLIGLITLIIWKIATSIHDRREFAKFEKERQNAKWNTEGNPLYKDPSNTFSNPVFSQQAK
ncbi:integrin beta-PS-like [Palaemon carinicauda]|uniref:integrin beta-PS-like n=1 Tax=Palaemon carinicauda TaxID=392227 RepID=UPI0035B5F59B